ncbi:MAG TPA: HlyD family efflux transporter periplasmic adaptor subunit [Steroidobacteraceae bacterium]
MASFRLGLACCVAALAASCARDGRVPAVGTIERHRFEIAAPAAEQIVAMPVTEGQGVRKGDLLAQLDGGALAASRDSLAAQASQLQHRLEELVHGARREELAQARAQLTAAEAQRLQATKEYERLAELVGRGLIAQSQVDQQQQLRDSSAAAVAVAQAGLELLQEGTRSEQLEQARAALRAAQAQLQQQQVLLARLQLVAPVDGVVEALPYRLGERPALGTPVVILLAGGVPYARVYIPEPQRAALRAGQNLQVHVDGFPQPFSGTLRYIAGEASFTPYFALTQRDRSHLAYLAEIDLGEPAARDLPAGVPVEVWLDRRP